MARGESSGLSRRRARRRQDVRDAERGPAPARPRHRRRRRLRRDARSRAARSSRSAISRSIPRKVVNYRGSEFEEMDIDAVLARAPEGRARRRARAHERAGVAPREALAGRRGAARGRHRRHLDGQHPAPRVGERRRRTHHRRAAARDAARRGRAAGRPGRARRQHARGAAPADGARQHLQAGEGRRRARELLPAGQPRRAARARAAVGRRQGRREPPAVHGGPRHHGRVGDARTDRRRARPARPAASTSCGARRAWRRAPKGDLLGVHVRAGEGLAGPPPGSLERHRALLEDLGGTYHEIVGADPSLALVDFARAERATQLVMGSSRRSRWSHVLRGSVINRVVRAVGRHRRAHHLDARAKTRSTVRAAPSARVLARRLPPTAGRGGGVRGRRCCPLLTLLLTHERDHVSLGSDLLLYLLLVVVVAAIGGAWVASVAAVVAFLLVNWYFTPPIHTWTISDGQNVLALVVFLVVAAVVSALVTAAARRAIEAARARSEAASLVRLAARPALRGRPAAEHHATAPHHVRDPIGRGAPARTGRTRGSSRRTRGRPCCENPADATATSDLPDDAVFAYDGPNLTGDDRRVLNAFVAQLAVALASRELRAEASTAVALAEADALRTALLRAVSHDLRTPLASIKASSSTLLADDLHLDDGDRAPAAPDDRRGGRPSQRARQQPARDEPAASGRVAARVHRRRSRRDRRPRAGEPRRPGGRSGRRRSRLAAARAGRSRARRARGRERGRQRARVVAARASGPARSRARRRRRRACA